MGRLILQLPSYINLTPYVVLGKVNNIQQDLIEQFPLLLSVPGVIKLLPTQNFH